MLLNKGDQALDLPVSGSAVELIFDNRTRYTPPFACTGVRCSSPKAFNSFAQFLMMR